MKLILAILLLVPASAFAQCDPDVYDCPSPSEILTQKLEELEVERDMEQEENRRALAYHAKKDREAEDMRHWERMQMEQKKLDLLERELRRDR